MDCRLWLPPRCVLSMSIIRSAESIFLSYTASPTINSISSLKKCCCKSTSSGRRALTRVFGYDVSAPPHPPPSPMVLLESGSAQGFFRFWLSTKLFPLLGCQKQWSNFEKGWAQCFQWLSSHVKYKIMGCIKFYCHYRNGCRKHPSVNEMWMEFMSW